MIKNYFKTAIRNLVKQRLYAIINITGLAVGIACGLLITLYVLDELSYDQFHANADRIYRIGVDAQIGENSFTTGHTNEHMSEVLDEIPEVRKTTRVHIKSGTVRLKNQFNEEKNIAYVDTTFLDIFSFPLKEGSRAAALLNPSSILLTERAADKYFGSSEGIVGQYLEVAGKDRLITGVLKNLPEQSHFTFDFLVPFTYKPQEVVNWLDIGNVITYVLLEDQVAPHQIEHKLDDLFRKYNAEAYQQISQIGYVNMVAQPLQDVYLHADFQYDHVKHGNPNTLYIFGAIAIFILLIAIVNFVNMATVRSGERAKEVGIRKALGSYRRQLIGQFLSESILMSLLATIIGLGLCELFRGGFYELSGKQISLNLLDNPLLAAMVPGITILVGVLAGLYPAYYLTRFLPVDILRGKFTGSRSGMAFRNGLVVFQFVICITLMIGTLLVYQQLQHMWNKELGFNKENVIVLENIDQLGEQYPSLKASIGSLASVVSFSASSTPPFETYSGTVMRENGTKEDQQKLISYLRIDEKYLETMGIQLQEGRGFQKEIQHDTAAMIINQAALKALGIDHPLNTVIAGGDGALFSVVGVTKNFNFESVDQPVRPLVMLFSSDASDMATMEIRISGDPAAVLEQIEHQWETMAPDVPFEYSFLDQDFDALFHKYQQQSKIITAFATLAILIACLGLFALASFIAEQRTKEIGVRKVLGATISQVIVLLARDFARLVLVAFVMSIPLAYWSVNAWLQSFAYRVNITVWPFLLVGGVALLLAWCTIGFQAFKAARANPVNALRHD